MPPPCPPELAMASGIGCELEQIGDHFTAFGEDQARSCSVSAALVVAGSMPSATCRTGPEKPWARKVASAARNAALDHACASPLAYDYLLFDDAWVALRVSNALLIIGMFMPKLGLVPFLGTTALAAGLGAVMAVLLTWAVSVARSHDPISWERATEKNRNTGTVSFDPPNSQKHP